MLHQRLHGKQHRAVDVIHKVQRRQNHQRRRRPAPHLSLLWSHALCLVIVEVEVLVPRISRSQQMWRSQLLLCSRPARFHQRPQSAARTELSAHLAPHRLGRLHHILQNLVHDVFLKDSQVAVFVDVFL